MYVACHKYLSRCFRAKEKIIKCEWLSRMSSCIFASMKYVQSEQHFYSLATFFLVNFFSSLSLEITIVHVKKCLCGHSEQNETYCNCLTFPSRGHKNKRVYSGPPRTSSSFQFTTNTLSISLAPCQPCHCSDLFSCPAVLILCTNLSTLHRKPPTLFASHFRWWEVQHLPRDNVHKCHTLVFVVDH